MRRTARIAPHRGVHVVHRRDDPSRPARLHGQDAHPAHGAAVRADRVAGDAPAVGESGAAASAKALVIGINLFEKLNNIPYNDNKKLSEYITVTTRNLVSNKKEMILFEGFITGSYSKTISDELNGPIRNKDVRDAACTALAYYSVAHNKKKFEKDGTNFEGKLLREKKPSKKNIFFAGIIAENDNIVKKYFIESNADLILSNVNMLPKVFKNRCR